MCITFDKIDGFIKIYDGTRYLLLSESQKNDSIYNRSVKSGITYIIFHNYAKIKVDSYDSLPLEKKMLFIMFWYLLSQFLIKIKLNTTIIYS